MRAGGRIFLDHCLIRVDPKVIVTHVAIMTIVCSFHKGFHGGDDVVVIAYVVQIQFVLNLVRSLILNSTIPGDNVQLVSRSQGHLESVPLSLPAWDTWRHTFEKKRDIIRT